MKIEKGEKARAFKTSDISGNSIDLNEYRGKKILLAFFRGASCPYCNLRVHEIIQHMDEFKSKGLEVIGIFISDKKEIMEYVGKQKPPFPIIADPEKKLYTLYSLEESLAGKIKAMFRMGSMMKILSKGFFSMKAMKDPNTLPGDFLINEDGTIEQAYYGKDFGDHLDFKIIRNWIDK